MFVATMDEPSTPGKAISVSEPLVCSQSLSAIKKYIIEILYAAVISPISSSDAVSNELHWN
jgi:hypothetical protein